MLSLGDTGVGMPEDVRQRAFEPFYTTKPVGEGTGLGLATVDGIVRQNGGHVALESTPGRGTTVRVFLPRTTDRSPTARPRRPTPVPRGSETVLLVEDQPEVRALAARILTSQGYRVVLAADGAQACELGARFEGDIHLVVTDLVMPGVDGVEVARRILSARPGARVLLVSGYSPTTLGDRAGLPPDVAFLAKPYTPAAFASKVREVLDGPRPADG
jgi:CheY-like chemotaxis protein